MAERVFSVFDLGDNSYFKTQAFLAFTRICRTHGYEVAPADVQAVFHDQGPNVADAARKAGVVNATTSAESSQIFWRYLYTMFLEALGIHDDELRDDLLVTFSDKASYKLFPEVLGSFEQLRAAVAASDADAALITTLVNVRYLTGLASSNAALLVPAEAAPVLATDSRYALAAERDCPDVELLTIRAVEAALAELAVSRGMSRLAFEAQEMTVERHTALAATDGLAVLVPLGHRVEELRVVKDDGELALLGRACEITGWQWLFNILDIIGRALREHKTGLSKVPCLVSIQAQARCTANGGADSRHTLNHSL